MGDKHRYLIALGSNRRHFPLGRPRDVLVAALSALEDSGITVLSASRPVYSRPLGPSLRTYANAAAEIETRLDPEALLELLKRTERSFGRRTGGQRWGTRVLDLDIVLWDGGPYAVTGLTIPHPRFRERAFVLAPAEQIAPDWRDPLTHLTLRQLKARLTAPRTLSR